ncbi:hypothetical protein WMF31_32885 [Sorangium sp. So ce1036]|uniref:hypothetical protein n=1 Tax=Sorangium sp. So ce1036 TaxID=3133328 RepID=UPI003F023A82
MASRRSRRDSLREKLLAEVGRQVERRLGGSGAELAGSQQTLAYLSWLAWHCSGFATVPAFLNAARADILAILHAGALGVERTAHVHARSLLENLVRHCYFDSRPSLFVARCLLPEEDVRDVWADLLEEIQRLPHFQPALGDAAETSILFSEIEHGYKQSSRFVHGSTARYRSLYRDIGSIDLDAERARDLDASLRRLGEACLLLLALYHLGPYLLVSQPIRRYMMRDAMGPRGRARFLRCMESVPVTWAQHQRAAALRTWRERKRKPFPTRDGLLLDRKGLALVASPRVSTTS